MTGHRQGYLPTRRMIVQVFRFANEGQRALALAKAKSAAAAYSDKTRLAYSWRFNGVDAYVVERTLLSGETPAGNDD